MELLGATRRQGLLPYPIDPALPDLEATQAETRHGVKGPGRGGPGAALDP